MKTYSPSNYTILLVDDVPKNLQVLGSILRESGYEVEYVTNGEKALDWVNRLDFDLILLDIMMPEMDGYEVCKLLRSQPKNDNLPILFITAKTDKESIIKGFKIGGQDYITKPFDSNELLARVKTHIELRESRIQLARSNEILEEKVQERTYELLLANEQLKGLDGAKNTFLRIISHEIRTPLNGILGMVEMISDSFSDESENMVVMTSVLQKACNRLEKFSLTALDITLLQTKGKKALNPKNQEIKQTISQLVQEVLPRATETSVTIVNSVSSSSFPYDSEYVVKMIRVLLLNAIKHTHKQGEVLISSSEERGYYCLSVKDEGSGFSTQVIGEGISSFGGYDDFDNSPGIDLYLCKLIVEAHNGKVELFNQQGAVVKVMLPLK